MELELESLKDHMNTKFFWDTSAGETLLFENELRNIVKNKSGWTCSHRFPNGRVSVRKQIGRRLKFFWVMCDASSARVSLSIGEEDQENVYTDLENFRTAIERIITSIDNELTAP